MHFHYFYKVLLKTFITQFFSNWSLISTQHSLTEEDLHIIEFIAQTKFLNNPSAN